MLDLPFDPFSIAHDRQLVFSRMPSVFLGKDIGITFSNRFGGIAKTILASLTTADADEPALLVLEVDAVGQIIHQGIQQPPFMFNRLLCPNAVRYVPENALDSGNLSRGVKGWSFQHLDINGLS